MTYLTTTQVAAATRTDIKTALTAGQLGDLPANIKISVTSRDGLTITIKNTPDEWAYTGERHTHTQRPSDAAKALGAKLADIARPHHAHGYDFGFVVLEDGACVASLGRPGWIPGQD
jgi:hypothetical protein